MKFTDIHIYIYVYIYIYIYIYGNAPLMRHQPLAVFGGGAAWGGGVRAAWRIKKKC